MAERVTLLWPVKRLQPAVGDIGMPRLSVLAVKLMPIISATGVKSHHVGGTHALEQFFARCLCGIIDVRITNKEAKGLGPNLGILFS
jgi:hypothetical protein